MIEDALLSAILCFVGNVFHYDLLFSVSGI
jgi:hypothetical protein